MKQLFIIGAMLIGLTASAQNRFNISTSPSSMVSTVDTLINDTTKYLYFGANNGKVNGRVEDLGITFSPLKVSGTVGAYGILQVSNDGTNWQNYFKTSADTVTVANVSGRQNFKWTVGSIDYVYWRIALVPTQSTQRFKIDGRYSVRSK